MGAMRLSDIRPSHLNPRKHFDPARIDELADSIRQFGIIEPIVVRFSPNSIADAQYEIIAGERRWRAAHKAGMEVVPVVIREVADDREALELALIENLVRADIDAIEEAEGYRKLSEMGHSQRAIAAKVNRSQSAVANAMRLLDLPESVREMIQNGHLSTSHGIALCSYKEWPRACEFLAEWAVEKDVPSKGLEGRLPPEAWLKAIKAGIVCSVGEGGYRAQCQFFDRLPSELLRETSWNSWVCMDPVLYGAIGIAFEEERQARIAETIATQKQQVVKQEVLGGNDGLAAGKDAEIAAPPDQRVGIMLDTLKWDEYMKVGDTPPVGCSEECPCRCQAVNRDGGSVTICMDPKRYKGLQDAKAKAERKNERNALKERMAVANEYLDAESDTLSSPGLRRAAILAVWSTFQDAGAERIKKAAERLGIVLEISDEWRGGFRTAPALWEQMDTLGINGLIRLAAEVALIRESENALAYVANNPAVPFMDWFLAKNGFDPSEPRENSFSLGRFRDAKMAKKGEGTDG